MVPSPIPCPRCGKPAAVHIFMECYLCYGCFWTQHLTAEEKEACWRIIPSPSQRRQEQPPVIEAPKCSPPPPAERDPVYFPGDCVANLEHLLIANKEELETDGLMSRIREKAGIRKRKGTPATIC